MDQRAIWAGKCVQLASMAESESESQEVYSIRLSGWGTGECLIWARFEPQIRELVRGLGLLGFCVLESQRGKKSSVERAWIQVAGHTGANKVWGTTPDGNATSSANRVWERGAQQIPLRRQFSLNCLPGTEMAKLLSQKPALLYHTFSLWLGVERQQKTTQTIERREEKKRVDRMTISLL